LKGIVLQSSINVARRVVALVAFLAVAGYACTGSAQSPAKAAADGTLTNANGMTLYVFDKDAGGKSACNGPCAANWPPLAATGDAKDMGDWTVVTRDDGSKQWAYKGKPLYAWAKDTKPGDKTGDGLNNVWHAAKQ
jgi:predicted lipoprotein with Yx(FWY)xxD motif